MKKQIVAIGIMTLGFVAIAAPKISERAISNYESAARTLGASAVEALIEICEEIPESFVSVKNPRVSILENAGGMDIGPVRYKERTKVKSHTHREYVGSFSTMTSEGDFVDGNVYKDTRVYDVQHRGYDVETSMEFEQGIKRMEEAARQKHPEACAEIGALIFVDVFKNKMGYSELKMMKYFKTAADGGSINGKYMVAYCTYFGIGCTANRGRAKMYLKEWAKAKEAAGESDEDSYRGKSTWSSKVLGK